MPGQEGKKTGDVRCVGRDSVRCRAFDTPQMVRPARQRVTQRRDAGDADRDVGLPFTPRPPERVGDDDRDLDTEAALA